MNIGSTQNPYSFYSQAIISGWCTAWSLTAIHELGHVLAAKLFDKEILEISIGSGLNPFRGSVRTERTTPSESTFICLTGPIAGGIAAATIYLFTRKFFRQKKANPWILGASEISAISLSINIENLCPLLTNSDGYWAAQSLQIPQYIQNIAGITIALLSICTPIALDIASEKLLH